MTWQRDKQWSDRFLPEIKAILGQHLIGEPPREEDAQHNTDLMVLRMEAVRIGCRIRKSGFFPRYSGEFTIRSGRPSGVKTELTKIIEGWGDYFLYGFSNPEGDRLSGWTLADLKVFRLHYNRMLARLDGGSYPGEARKNGDGSSDFVVFCWDQFPPEFIVGQSMPGVGQQGLLFGQAAA